MHFSVQYALFFVSGYSDLALARKRTFTCFLANTSFSYCLIIFMTLLKESLFDCLSFIASPRQRGWSRNQGVQQFKVRENRFKPVKLVVQLERGLAFGFRIVDIIINVCQKLPDIAD